MQKESPQREENSKRKVATIAKLFARPTLRRPSFFDSPNPLLDQADSRPGLPDPD